jgi:hypothetical protein
MQTAREFGPFALQKDEPDPFFGYLEEGHAKGWSSSLWKMATKSDTHVGCGETASIAQRGQG